MKKLFLLAWYFLIFLWSGDWPKRGGVKAQSAGDIKKGRPVGQTVRSTRKVGDALTKEVLSDLYYKEGLSQKTISERLGVSVISVRKYMAIHGLKARKGCPMPKGKQNRTDWDKIGGADWVYSQYILFNRGAKEIAEEIGVTEQKLYHYMSKNNIKRSDPQAYQGKARNFKVVTKKEEAQQDLVHG